MTVIRDTMKRVFRKDVFENAQQNLFAGEHKRERKMDVLFFYISTMSVKMMAITSSLINFFWYILTLSFFISITKLSKACRVM